MKKLTALFLTLLLLLASCVAAGAENVTTWIVTSYSDKRDKALVFWNSSGDKYPSVP